MENNVKLLVADGWDEATAEILAEGRVSSSAAKLVQAKEKTIQAVIAEFEVEQDFADLEKSIDEIEAQHEHELLLEGIWQAYETAYFEDLVEFDKALKATPGPYKDMLEALDKLNTRINSSELRNSEKAQLRKEASAKYQRIQKVRDALEQEARELCAIQLLDVITSGAWDHVQRYHPQWMKKIDHDLVKSYQPQLFEDLDKETE